MPKLVKFRYMLAEFGQVWWIAGTCWSIPVQFWSRLVDDMPNLVEVHQNCRRAASSSTGDLIISTNGCYRVLCAYGLRAPPHRASCGRVPASARLCAHEACCCRALRNEPATTGRAELVQCAGIPKTERSTCALCLKGEGEDETPSFARLSESLARGATGCGAAHRRECACERTSKPTAWRKPENNGHGRRQLGPGGSSKRGKPQPIVLDRRERRRGPICPTCSGSERSTFEEDPIVAQLVSAGLTGSSVRTLAPLRLYKWSPGSQRLRHCRHPRRRRFRMSSSFRQVTKSCPRRSPGALARSPTTQEMASVTQTFQAWRALAALTSR